MKCQKCHAPISSSEYEYLQDHGMVGPEHGQECGCMERDEEEGAMVCGCDFKLWTPSTLFDFARSLLRRQQCSQSKQPTGLRGGVG